VTLADIGAGIDRGGEKRGREATRRAAGHQQASVPVACSATAAIRLNDKRHDDVGREALSRIHQVRGAD